MRAGRVGAAAAGAARVQRQGELADLALGGGDLVRAHCLEIHRLQPFVGRDGEGGVHLLPLLGRFRRLLAALLHRLGEAAGAGRGALGRLLRGRGAAIAAAAFPASGSRQNRAKAWSNRSACSWRWIMLARSAVRTWRAAAEIDQRDRLLRRQHLRRPDRQPGAAQQAGEVHEVGGEAAARHDGRHGRHALARCRPPRASGASCRRRFRSMLARRARLIAA